MASNGTAKFLEPPTQSSGSLDRAKYSEESYMSEIPRIKTYIRDGIPEVDVDEVLRHAKHLRLIDVRREDEFNNELGHVAGSELITLGPELEDFISSAKSQNAVIVFICRSGNRSGTATLIAREQGLQHVYNMTGGMIRWNELQLPVERA
jgi:rhodanese-related sulfurtransferase